MEEYNEIYCDVGKVNIFGQNWFLYNVKTITDYLYNKIPNLKIFKRI